MAGARTVQAQQPGVWNATGSLGAGRSFGHTATLLANGKVLVVGGANILNSCCPRLGSAELYDPATGQWGVTCSLGTPRAGHIAVRLSNGKVLVAGGSTGATWDNLVSSAEIYDPDSGAWSATGNLSVAR